MTEIWKDVKGYEGLYQISNLGRVKSFWFRKETILSLCNDKEGYKQVKISDRNKNQIKVKVHRLVAQNFISNPENKRCVNHINGIKYDNRLTNLEWVTHSENVKHAYKIGLKKPLIGKRKAGSNV